MYKRLEKQKPGTHMPRILALMLLALLFVGCSVFQKSGNSKLSFKLQLEPSLARATQPNVSKMLQRETSSNGSKSIMPSNEWRIAKYTIDGLHSDGSTITLTSTTTSVSADLKPGDWTFTVKAFTAAGQELASAVQEANLQPNRSATISVTLLPLQGQGSLELTVTSNYALSSSELITGYLKYMGLPGYPKPTSPPSIPIILPYGQSVFTSSSLDAGYYELGLSIRDSSGVEAVGLADVVLVLTGMQTKGACKIEAGDTSISFSPQAIDLSPLSAPTISVRHMLSYDARIASLAIPPSGNEFANLETSWYMNGSNLGSNFTKLDPGRFPSNTLFFPAVTEAPGLSQVRIDLIARSADTGRTTSAYTLLDFIEGPQGKWSTWFASYDYRAAMGQSVFRRGVEGNTGTGTKTAIRGLACSQEGLVVVTGMDYDSAIHTFASPSGVRIGNPNYGTLMIPPNGSWVRLWRDQFKVDGGTKNADVVVVSKDGLHIAATQTGSTTGWLRIYDLDPSGEIVSTFTTSPASGGPSNLRELKALRFSDNGTKLYAVSGQSKSLFAFANDGSGWSLRSTLALTDIGSSSQNVRALEVTPSGNIVISSAETSKLFVFKEDESGNLSLDHTIVPNTSGYILKAPSALAISSYYDGFYVLNDGKEVLLYTRSEPSKAYTLHMGIPLEPSVANADSISALDLMDGYGTESLCVVGGTDVGLYNINTYSSTLADSDLIHPDARNLTGLANADTDCCDGKSFIIGGGSSGVVSVIGIR